MPVSLTKITQGQNVSLTKTASDAGETLTSVTVGLGWDARSTDGQDFDLDASAVLCDASGNSVDGTLAGSMVFFNNKKSPDGSIEHTGDNLTGKGDGDDEQIKVNLAAVPANVDKIVFVVTIHEAIERKQNFGQVRNAYVRVVNDSSGTQLTDYDLAEDYGAETAMEVAELYRKDGDWKFRAVGQGHNSGLEGIAKNYAIAVA